MRVDAPAISERCNLSSRPSDCPHLEIPFLPSEEIIVFFPVKQARPGTGHRLPGSEACRPIPLMAVGFRDVSRVGSVQRKALFPAFYLRVRLSVLER